MAAQFATIWRSDSPVARCRNCGAQQQFHGRPNFSCTDFVAETAADVDPADLATPDLIRHTGNLADRLDVLERLAQPTSEQDREADQLYVRVKACRDELQGRIKAVFGLPFDDLAGTLGLQVL